MREIHLIQNQEIGLCRVIRSAQHQLQRTIRRRAVFVRLQGIGIAQQVFIASPVRTDCNNAVLLVRITQPHGKGFGEPRFYRSPPDLLGLERLVSVAPKNLLMKLSA